MASTVPVPEKQGKNPTLETSATNDLAKKDDFVVSAIEDYESPTKTERSLNQPTEDEQRTLRHIAGPIPWVAFILCIVEFAERASYYGATQVFNNFLQFPLPEGGNGAGSPAQEGPKALMEKPAGALNGGLQFANAFTLLFKFLAYTVPVLGAYIGDVRIGRYSAIMLGVLICGVSHIIQILGALPSILQKGQGMAPFLISLFLLAVGAGIFKPNILPTVLDQYQDQQPYIQTLKSGERVIVDPEMTINRISLIFYSFVNIGALIGIPTSYAEKLVGFWLAFLVPGVIYFLLPVILVFTKKHTKITKPKGSALQVAFQVTRTALQQSRGAFWKPGFWDAARPAVLAQKGITTYAGAPITWNDADVEDVRRAFQACRLFLWFPIWYLNDGGIGVVATSQASSMTKNGVPNDLLGNLNPITVICFSPILSFGIYPLLERYNMMPGRITRITIGFTLAWISSIYGALVQRHIYNTSPCGTHATKCDIGAGVSPVTVWVQVPIYMLGAMSECLAQVTAYEIAYARAPKNMKAIVMSAFLFMNALSSAIALIASPAIKDPYLVWVWAAPGIVLFVISILFYWRNRGMNKDEYMLRTRND